MSIPIIGIAANEKKDAGEGMGHMSVSYNPSGYIKAVQIAGGLPIMMPISGPDMAKLYVNQIDKLVLAGGQNVAPEFYGEVKLTESTDYSRERDAFEFALVEEAIKQKKPILGVCRGMQLVNAALGGTINQKVKNHWQTEDFYVPTHHVFTKHGSHLQKIFGTKTHVNSFHHQGVKRVAPDLTVTAWSEGDNVIEGLESANPSVRFLGVQWHPDFAYQHSKKELEFFRYFVQMG
ncbi:MAG: gamma-glutamyl-gamma-aminobutyrate hydrolase family protein [Lactobacillales bacterium]|jgi:putative glutamine amidotransferase|nr:gamma-glutamyl-gamma-aminobutyrate hydrolase family protein [Lactobacillales bacterium]